MHAVVDLRHPHEGLDHAASASLPGIPQPHFDVLVGIQRDPGVFVLVAVDVVDQHPHPDAAVGGLEDFVGEQAAHRVLVVHVVLNVEALLGHPGQQGTRREGVAPVR